MTPRSDPEAAKDEVLRVARGMLSGDIDVVVGSRRLCELRHVIGESDNPVFLPIVGFESETDDYPVGTLRERYDQEYLRKVDREVAEYIGKAKPAVLGACRAILEVLDG